jgi:hypothetical protein
MLSAQWLPEIRHFLPKETPIVEVEVEVDEGSNREVSSKEGSQVAMRSGALFVRCPQHHTGKFIKMLVRVTFWNEGERGMLEANTIATQCHFGVGVVKNNIRSLV